MRRAWILALLATTACVERYAGPASPPTPPSPEEGTVTSTSAGPMGPLERRIECDPVQSAGCDAVGNEACVYDPGLDNATCEVLSSRLEHEAACSPLDNACDRNLTCTALPQDHESICYRVCDPDTGGGCENLPGRSPNYMCMRLFDRSYGVCVGTGIRCDPNEDPCAATEVCSFRGGEAVCLPAGAAKLGEPCATEQCEKGAMCTKLTDVEEARCYLPCDVEDGVCPNPNEVCTGLDGQRFGICQVTEAACSPLAGAQARCPDGQTCSLDRTNPVCVAPGPIEVGGDCGPEAACAAPGPGFNGAVCARLLGQDAPKCYESCDLSFPTCSNPGTGCSDIGLGFGICI